MKALPNARGEERSDGRVRMMLLLVSSFLEIRVDALASLETHRVPLSEAHALVREPVYVRRPDCGMSHATKVTESHVVREEDKNVRCPDPRSFR